MLKKYEATSQLLGTTDLEAILITKKFCSVVLSVAKKNQNQKRCN